MTKKAHRRIPINGENRSASARKKLPKYRVTREAARIVPRAPINAVLCQRVILGNIFAKARPEEYRFALFAVQLDAIITIKAGAPKPSLCTTLTAFQSPVASLERAPTTPKNKDG